MTNHEYSVTIKKYGDKTPELGTLCYRKETTVAWCELHTMELSKENNGVMCVGTVKCKGKIIYRHSLKIEEF
jgi:hypothetical protein